MYQYKFATIFGVLSTIVSILGIIFFFINPSVTCYCALFSLLNSLIQITVGGQNNLNTEISTIIIALIIALIGRLNILRTISFAICLIDVLMYIFGLIYMWLNFKNRF